MLLQIASQEQYYLDSCMETTRECPARSRGHAENNRVLGDNRVIGEAISAHDTAPAAVTIKPHNRTIALDQSRAHIWRRGAAPGFRIAVINAS